MDEQTKQALIGALKRDDAQGALAVVRRYAQRRAREQERKIAHLSPGDRAMISRLRWRG